MNGDDPDEDGQRLGLGCAFLIALAFVGGLTLTGVFLLWSE